MNWESKADRVIDVQKYRRLRLEPWDNTKAASGYLKRKRVEDLLETLGCLLVGSLYAWMVYEVLTSF